MERGSMKKFISYLLLTAMLALGLGGCGKPEEAPPDASDAERPSDIAVDTDSLGRDNSLDVYSAAVHTPLVAEEPADAVWGGTSMFFLGAGRAYFYTRYWLEAAQKGLDELSFVTTDEEKGSRRFDHENRLFGIGPVAGTDHYIGFGFAASEDGENLRYFLTERDENHETVKKIPLDFLTSPADSYVLPSYLAADGSGRVHLVYQPEGLGQQYLLVSPEGELLFSTGSDMAGLVPLWDGRIAFWQVSRGSGGSHMVTSLRCMDGETGKLETLASLEDSVDYVTLFDENTLLYANREGIYRSSLSGENPELLYRWINHGISRPERISALQADAEGNIALIYKDSENNNYLRLKPTTEQVEICTITLAAGWIADKYMEVVTEFNKRYPRWHIEIMGDYDKTALLTQLGAGDGPVLIDAGMLGFEGLEKLWEPLEAVLEQLGVAEELVPSVLELGKINGVQYGVAPDFYLSTLVTANQDLEEWDYGAFLQCIRDSPNLEAVFDIYGGGNFGTYLIVSFLTNGLDDAYFWDAEAGTTNFDSSEFRQALELANRYCAPKEKVPVDRALLGESVLCNRIRIDAPEEVAGIRIYCGEDGNNIGYPSKDGSVYYMESNSLMAIRRTATAEEKEIAIAFLDLLLSYEGQKLMAKGFNYGMSVRLDMLEEQIAAMGKSTRVVLGEPGNSVSFALGNQLDVDLDRETLMHLIETAQPKKYFPEELNDILWEELEQYFSGDITEDMLIDHLENRVGLYLNENR